MLHKTPCPRLLNYTDKAVVLLMMSLFRSQKSGVCCKYFLNGSIKCGGCLYKFLPKNVERPSVMRLWQRLKPMF